MWALQVEKGNAGVRQQRCLCGTGEHDLVQMCDRLLVGLTDLSELSNLNASFCCLPCFCRRAVF